MNEDEFKKRFGFLPIQDELERAVCKEAGTVGHFQCGVCDKCNKPRFICGHMVKK